MCRKLLIALTILLISVRVSAKLLYKWNFDSDTDTIGWKFNNAANEEKYNELVNLWYLGLPGNFSANPSSKGLFVSGDGGKTATYKAEKPSYIVTYKELTLPVGDYDLFFNWQAYGKATGSDALHVCWVPASYGKDLYSAYNVLDVKDWTKDYRLDTTGLTLAQSWQYATRKFHSDGQPGKLAFLWFNSTGNPKEPSGCVDNIEIHQHVCQEPTGISHTAVAGTVYLNWQGSADYYSVKVYDPRNNLWFEADTVKTPQIEIPNISEGVHTFYIRSHCGEDMSAYAVYTVFVAFAGTRCIDYMTLSNKNCGIGEATELSISLGECVDYGYANKYSRHTIHYLEDEYDPRTNYELKTVPEGELASVRLGNWDIYGQAERIEYMLHVGEESEILKLKYAVVMNSPGEKHPINLQTKFTLEILDRYRQPLDPNCFSAHFSAGYNAQGIDCVPDSTWHELQTHDPQTGDLIELIYWKEWTEIALSLRDYTNSDIIIRLTTYDCTENGHYCYAYFTLGCESGALQGLTCGQRNESFTAPSGFKYRWYRKTIYDNATDKSSLVPLSYDSVYTLTDLTDTTTYLVQVINPTTYNTEHECFYTLEANAMPRVPVAKIDTIVEISDCEYHVTFTNNSFIKIVTDNQGNYIVSDEKPDTYIWDFGDGKPLETKEKSLTRTYPITGGQNIIKLTAFMANGGCENTDIFTLNLQDLSEIDVVEEYHKCDDGQGWLNPYDKTVWYTEQADTSFAVNAYGCDSRRIVKLLIHGLTPTKHTDTICAKDLPYRFFNGTDSIEIYKSGIYSGRIPHHFTSANSKQDCDCDSVFELELYVEENLEVDIANNLRICPDNGVLQVPYSVNSGRLDSICIEFGQKAVQLGFDDKYCFPNGENIVIPMPADIAPDIYPIMISFVTPLCTPQSRSVDMEIGYSAEMLNLKDNGWIGLINAKEFDDATYQWYRDGEPIPNARESYYSFMESDRGHSFYVVVSKKGSGIGISTCPIVYSGSTDLEQTKDTTEHHQIFKILYNGQIYIIRNGLIYNVMGQLIQN